MNEVTYIRVPPGGAQSQRHGTHRSLFKVAFRVSSVQTRRDQRMTEPERRALESMCNTRMYIWLVTDIGR